MPHRLSNRALPLGRFSKRLSLEDVKRVANQKLQGVAGYGADPDGSDYPFVWSQQFGQIEYRPVSFDVEANCRITRSKNSFLSGGTDFAGSTRLLPGDGFPEKSGQQDFVSISMGLAGEAGGERSGFAKDLFRRRTLFPSQSRSR